MSTYEDQARIGQLVRHAATAADDGLAGKAFITGLAEAGWMLVRTPGRPRQDGRPATWAPDAVKLTEEQVRAMRAVPLAHGVVSALARQYGVSPSCVWNVMHGKTWKHVTTP